MARDVWWCRNGSYDIGKRLVHANPQLGVAMGTTVVALVAIILE